MNKLRLGIFLFLAIFTLAACDQPTRVVTVIVTQDDQDIQTEPTRPPTDQIYKDCAGETAGSFVTCRIGRAYCSYRPDINGEPTFCNDAPFPSHSFTLLVWGQNWSDYDGRCLAVTGQITRFEGKPQIVATSRSQVGDC